MLFINLQTIISFYHKTVATGEYRVKIAVFEAGWVIRTQTLTQKGTTISAQMHGQASECLTTLPLTFFTQRNFAADFLRAKYNFTAKNDQFAFLSPHWGLGATYAVNLRLIASS